MKRWISRTAVLVTTLGALTAGMVGVSVIASADEGHPLPANSDRFPCKPPVDRKVQGRMLKVQFCPLWRGNVPVYRSTHPAPGERPVDWLYVAGTADKPANWFTGETFASPHTVGRYTNRWWAYTLGDNGRWGWVSEVYFKGGAPNEPDGGMMTRCQGGVGAEVRTCGV